VQPVRSAYQTPAKPSGTSQTNRLVISLPFKYSFRIKIFVAIDFFLQL
jgi:hypothetical protein